MAAASVVVKSVTNQEIARYWKIRRMVEEDHLYAAVKAAARLRARNLSDEDYRQFEEYLKEDDQSNDTEKHENKEIRVGIKDWWTKSKYAYLNQPAMNSSDNPRRRCSSYLPQFFSYSSTSPLKQAYGYSRQRR
ncbi:UNVERIFIED_CONTAM: hypothetical protein Scaly_1114900 [Sesamum calycinum]|uniref:Uncharacterized protein n=1 Tax=Sesamum calycinum TaxID=2727403 RepID=A0AAW2QLZ4_9LAMI